MNHLSNGAIKKVLVVDDDAEARDALGYPIEELDITPVPERGPITDLTRFVEGVRDRAQAVLCDYQLTRSGKYSTFNGDELIAACYRQGIPGLLCTQYTAVVIEMNRRLRRFIPSLLTTSCPAPDAIHDSLRRCQEELDGVFHPARKPWRTLVRVHDVSDDASHCHVVVPAWSYNQVIRLYFQDLPDRLRPHMTTGTRLHAKVNIGAHAFDEVYFYDWETE